MGATGASRGDSSITAKTHKKQRVQEISESHRGLLEIDWKKVKQFYLISGDTSQI